MKEIKVGDLNLIPDTAEFAGYDDDQCEIWIDSKEDTKYIY